ncbi:zinc metalloprotease [Chitinophaga arvensicola]|uniref:Peptidase M50B-like n=1 Tax=Chitinophaga arvensicola TaxID=29529 RepID=A0A1I0S9L3_9BACT|nr:M50 family metallopeptidase [Chitinophaga arvensicola]SEW52874.1 Peptidase M50B-like [Chitinophaga arvensicola]
MIWDILIFLLIALLIFIARFLTILVHELGHAVPAMIFTRQPVAIYIGSFGDDEGNVQFNKGLLEINIKRNPLLWRKGLCVAYDDDMNIRQRLIQVLAGPLSSIVIAGIAVCFSVVFDLHGSIKLISGIFLFSAMFDLVLNLYPRTMQLDNYSTLDTDGKQVLNLLRDWSYERSMMKRKKRYPSKNNLRKI